MKKLAIGTGAAVLLLGAAVWSWDRGWAGERTARAGEPSEMARLRVLGEESGVEWSEVRGAAFMDDDLVVITRSTPAVHLFSESGHTSWGQSGSGPAELKDASMVAVAGDRVLVYDLELAKLASYARDGTFSGTRQVGIVNAVFAAGADTVVGSVDMMAPTRRVLRLRGEQVDTLYHYELPERIRLSAPGSPSYTVVSPYAAVPQWAVLADGRLATWDPAESHLVVRGFAGSTAVTLPVGAARYDVAVPDRELWLKEAIPTEFMGQRVFEPLREEARRSVAFPQELPPVLAIKGDPQGGVWVQRTTLATGEVWTQLDENGVVASFRLPVGRKLLAMGRSEVAVLARDANDVESVEIYQKPRTRLAS